MRKLILLAAILLAVQVWARTNYTGYSGAPGRQTCAISCHGSSGGAIHVLGFPTSYTPGQVYRIVVNRSSGNTIRNFNASCRVGTGSTNAGLISASTNTSVYSTSGETNGVHLSTSNRDSGVFNWMAPIAGTGTVRLYVAGLQGSASGVNTTYVGISTESVVNLPGATSNPHPVNGATGIAPGVDTLSWTRGTNSTSNDVYFGTTNPPPVVAFSSDSVYVTRALLPGTTYYWRVDARNAAGFTEGTVWHFSTSPVTQPFNPHPLASDSITANPVTFQWEMAESPVPSYLVFRLGQTNPPPVIDSLAPTAREYADSLREGEGVYYWQIDQAFSWGVVNGTTWSFTYTAPSSVPTPTTIIPNDVRLENAYPNPFNPTTTIRYSLPQSATVSLKVYNLVGNEVETLVQANQNAGSYSVNWDGKNEVSGMYFYRLTVNKQTLTGSMLLMK